MHNFTPLASLAGGVLIGISASILLLMNGRIAGISGIVGGMLKPASMDWGWRLYFVGGLIVAGLIGRIVSPGAFAIAIPRSLPMFLLAGVLVGFGTRLGGGCTSGHGVCGLSRGSIPSLAATMAFTLAGVITVYVVNHLLGGSF
ncbi:MAG: YeeE/YedE family protein [Candidatus Binataceae bacterium]|nr:YeeE/YedE family protein [Candidatus Binataceae bacterium]